MALMDEGRTIKNIRERISYIQAAVRARFLQKLRTSEVMIQKRTRTEGRVRDEGRGAREVNEVRAEEYHPSVAERGSGEHRLTSAAARDHAAPVGWRRAR
jgi:hypothetical protein